MKKNFLLVVVLMLAFVGSAAAQNRAGVHLVFGSEIDQPGIGFNGEFFVAEKVSIAPELDLFLPEKSNYTSGGTKVNVKASTWSIGGDVHYYFVSDDKIGFYGLAGLNLAVFKGSVKTTNPTTESSTSDSEVGLNLGAGINFKVAGKVTPFAQLKYQTNYEQLLLQAGIRFNLN
jgi:opacity protein-like surface antigen